MKSKVDPAFWRRFNALPLQVQQLARNAFALGGWASGYFNGTARTWEFWTSSLTSGIILWHLIFLWLLPLIRRRRGIGKSPEGQNKP